MPLRTAYGATSKGCTLLGQSRGQARSNDCCSSVSQFHQGKFSYINLCQALPKRPIVSSSSLNMLLLIMITSNKNDIKTICRGQSQHVNLVFIWSLMLQPLAKSREIKLNRASENSHCNRVCVRLPKTLEPLSKTPRDNFSPYKLRIYAVWDSVIRLIVTREYYKSSPISGRIFAMSIFKLYIL